MKIKLLFAVLLLSAIACGRTSPRRLELYPSPTVLPTQTERVVIWTSTPIYTYTPFVKIVTETPSPEYLCVTADETVYLRPSPGIDNYPIAPLPNGARLTDLGGRQGGFAFVSNGEQQGWVNLNFVENCK